MELTIVGCSGSVSGPDGPASSYLVQAPHAGRTFSLLLDCGPGAFGALYRYLDPAEVDAIGLSHLHPDHCLDLCAFYVGARYSPTAPWPRIPVHAPAGAAERIDRAYDPGDGSESGPSTHFGFTAWADEKVIGPFAVAVAPVEHPVPAYAIRVFETATGASLVFSGDTGPCPALVELASGADLLLCEAAFADAPDNPPGLHLSPTQAAEHATAAGVGRLVLTHVPPWLDPETARASASAATDVPVEVASPGSRWTVG